MEKLKEKCGGGQLSGCLAMLKDLERAQQLGAKLRRTHGEKEKYQLGHKVEPLVVSPYYWQHVSDELQSGQASEAPLNRVLSKQLDSFQETFKALKNHQQNIRWAHHTFSYDIAITFKRGQPAQHYEGLSHSELHVLQTLPSGKTFSVEELDFTAITLKEVENCLERLLKRQILSVDTANNNRYFVIGSL